MAAQLERIAWQERLAAPRLRRSELAGLVPSWPCRPVRVHVVRNAPFELVAACLPPFLAYAGLEAAISYGPYDDSLSDPAGDLPDCCDAVVVWLDLERYGDVAPAQLAGFVADRVGALRARSEAPLLVADWTAAHDGAVALRDALAQRLAGLPATHLCAVSALAAALGDAWSDARLAAVSGSSLSDRACLETARAFGLRWLPAVLVPPVKAIVVDLDHTLYHGVLGEDGPHGLVVSEGHERLQRELLACRSRGVYLAVASKNDEVDVEALYAARPDLLLRPEHLSARAVGWSSKAEGLVRIAEELCIAPDAMVFVDDNAAELAEVATRLPAVGLVHARDPSLTAALLGHYPGLFGFGVGANRREAIRRSRRGAAP